MFDHKLTIHDRDAILKAAGPAHCSPLHHDDVTGLHPATRERPAWRVWAAIRMLCTQHPDCHNPGRFHTPGICGLGGSFGHVGGRWPSLTRTNCSNLLVAAARPPHDQDRWQFLHPRRRPLDLEGCPGWSPSLSATCTSHRARGGSSQKGPFFPNRGAATEGIPCLWRVMRRISGRVQLRNAPKALLRCHSCCPLVAPKF